MKVGVLVEYDEDRPEMIKGVKSAAKRAEAEAWVAERPNSRDVLWFKVDGATQRSSPPRVIFFRQKTD